MCSRVKGCSRSSLACSRLQESLGSGCRCLSAAAGFSDGFAIVKAYVGFLFWVLVRGFVLGTGSGFVG